MFDAIHALYRRFKVATAPITEVEMVREELYEAKQKLLKAQSGLEYAYTDVQYNTMRVARLARTLEALQANQPMPLPEVPSVKAPEVP